VSRDSTGGKVDTKGGAQTTTERKCRKKKGMVLSIGGKGGDASTSKKGTVLAHLLRGQQVGRYRDRSGGFRQRKFIGGPIRGSGGGGEVDQGGLHGPD